MGTKNFDAEKMTKYIVPTKYIVQPDLHCPRCGRPGVELELEPDSYLVEDTFLCPSCGAEFRLEMWVDGKKYQPVEE